MASNPDRVRERAASQFGVRWLATAFVPTKSHGKPQHSDGQPGRLPPADADAQEKPRPGYTPAGRGRASSAFRVRATRGW